MNPKFFYLSILSCSQILAADLLTNHNITAKENTAYSPTAKNFVCKKEDILKHPNYRIRELASIVDSITFSDEHLLKIVHINVSYIDKNGLYFLWEQIHKIFSKDQIKAFDQKNIKLFNIDIVNLANLPKTTSTTQCISLIQEELFLNYEKIFALLSVSKVNELRIVIQNVYAFVDLINSLSSLHAFPDEIKKLHIINIAQQALFDKLLIVLSRYSKLEEIKLVGMTGPLSSHLFSISPAEIAQEERKFRTLREKVYLKTSHLESIKKFSALKRLFFEAVIVPDRLSLELKELAKVNLFELSVKS